MGVLSAKSSLHGQALTNPIVRVLLLSNPLTIDQKESSIESSKGSLKLNQFQYIILHPVLETIDQLTFSITKKK